MSLFKNGVNEVIMTEMNHVSECIENRRQSDSRGDLGLKHSMSNINSSCIHARCSPSIKVTAMCVVIT